MHEIGKVKQQLEEAEDPREKHRPYPEEKGIAADSYRYINEAEWDRTFPDWAHESTLLSPILLFWAG